MNNTPVNILLIEDDEIDIMNVKKALKKLQLSCALFVANDGEEALRMLYSHEVPYPRVILLDLNMPKMNGIEFLSRVRTDEELRHNMVFIMTTSNEERDKQAAFNLNVSGYIIKHFDSNEFIASFAKLSNFWMVNQFPENHSL
jgi:CheY-like chemotaxis protein